MEEYEAIAAALSLAAGREVVFDPEKFAYVVDDEGVDLVIGYADEDVVEIVDGLVRMYQVMP